MRWLNRCRSNYRDDVAMINWTKEELREAKLILDCSGTMTEAAKKTSHNRNSLSHKINIMGMDFWEERKWDRYVVG